MAGLSDVWERKLLDCIFNQTNITAPTTIFLSLHTADPGDTGASEHPSSGAYARVAVTTSFPAASGTSGALANDAQINFPTATADWTAVTHWGLWDASSGGNFICGDALAAPRTVTNGVTLQVLVGDMVVTAS